MRHLFEFVQRLSADTVRGRGRIVQFRVLRLQPQQLGIHPVIFVVGDFRIIVHIVALGVVCNLIAQFFQSLFGFTHICTSVYLTHLLLLYQIYPALSRGGQSFFKGYAIISYNFYPICKIALFHLYRYLLLWYTENAKGFGLS